MKLNKNIYDRMSSSHAYHRSSHSFFCSNQRLGNGRGQLVLLGCSGKQGDQCVEKNQEMTGIIWTQMV